MRICDLQTLALAGALGQKWLKTLASIRPSLIFTPVIPSRFCEKSAFLPCHEKADSSQKRLGMTGVFKLNQDYKHELLAGLSRSI
jgi:hypothetical protein